MNIIFASQEDADELQKKYVVLELDTLRIPGSTDLRTAWCVVELSDLNITEVPVLDQYRNLHNNMMKNYRLKNWKYCEDALEHLRGRWKGVLDGFYNEIDRRIKEYKNKDPGESWTGVYDKTSSI